MLQIIHTSDALAMIRPTRSILHWLHNDLCFEMVALIDTTLDHVFELTNHGEDNWTEHQLVKWHINHPVRSTSIGDIITDAHNQQAWLVVSSGFADITRHIFPQCWLQSTTIQVERIAHETQTSVESVKNIVTAMMSDVPTINGDIMNTIKRDRIQEAEVRLGLRHSSNRPQTFIKPNYQDKMNW